MGRPSRPLGGDTALKGMLALALAVWLVGVVAEFWPLLHKGREGGLISRERGEIYVEVVGPTRWEGVYKASQGTSVLGFLAETVDGAFSGAEGQCAKCLLTGDSRLALRPSPYGWTAQVDPMTPRKAYLLGSGMDVNRAKPSELLLVAGIGTKTARGIVSYRWENGPLGDLEELLKVKGVTRKKLDGWRGVLKTSPWSGNRCACAIYIR